MGARESMENRREDSPEKKSLTGSGTEFENDAKWNREPMKRFQEWERMRKPGRPWDNPS